MGKLNLCRRQGIWYQMIPYKRYQNSISTEKKIQLTNERHVLVGSYFYTYISHLLGFDTKWYPLI